MNGSNEVGEKISKSRSRGKNLEFPAVSLEEAVKVAGVIMENSGIVREKSVIEKAIGRKGGALQMRITGAKRYGLIEGNGELRLTELGKQVLHPISKQEEGEVKRKAVLQVPLFKEIYQKYGNQLPDRNVLKAVLHREYGVQVTATIRAIHVMKRNLEDIVSLKNEIEDTQHFEEEKAEKIEDDITESEFRMKEVKFPLKIITPFEKHIVDVTDDMDWDMVDSIIASLKNKWRKAQVGLFDDGKKPE